jgi:hypothetical protein
VLALQHPGTGKFGQERLEASFEFRAVELLGDLEDAVREGTSWGLLSRRRLRLSIFVGSITRVGGLRPFRMRDPRTNELVALCNVVVARCIRSIGRGAHRTPPRGRSR